MMMSKERDLPKPSAQSSSLKKHLQYLSLFSIGCTTLSLVFWAWAIIITTNKDGVDLGVFSFGASALSSVYLLYRTFKVQLMGNKDEQDLRSIGQWERIIIIATYLVVFANYVLGVWGGASKDPVPVGFVAYCIIFTVLWMVIALLGWILIGRTMTQMDNTGMDDEDFDS